MEARAAGAAGAPGRKPPQGFRRTPAGLARGGREGGAWLARGGPCVTRSLRRCRARSPFRCYKRLCGGAPRGGFSLVDRAGGERGDAPWPAAAAEAWWVEPGAGPWRWPSGPVTTGRALEEWACTRNAFGRQTPTRSFNGRDPCGRLMGAPARLGPAGLRPLGPAGRPTGLRPARSPRQAARRATAAACQCRACPSDADVGKLSSILRERYEGREGAPYSAGLAAGWDGPRGGLVNVECEGPVAIRTAPTKERGARASQRAPSGRVNQKKGLRHHERRTDHGEGRDEERKDAPAVSPLLILARGAAHDALHGRGHDRAHRRDRDQDPDHPGPRSRCRKAEGRLCSGSATRRPRGFRRGGAGSRGISPACTTAIATP